MTQTVLPPEFSEKYRALLVLSARAFDVEGYCAFHELMLGLPPAKHHIPWIEQHFAALEQARASGNAQEARRLTEAPPGSAKSTIIELWATWRIGHCYSRYREWAPEVQAGISALASVSDDQAQARAASVAENIAANPLFQQVFPGLYPWRERGWGVEKGYWVKVAASADAAPEPDFMEKMAARRDATIWGGGYRNRAWIGRRVTLDLLVDDVLDEDNTRSEVELAHVNQKITKTIFSRAEPGSLIWFVGTPWLHNDTYDLLAKSGLYLTDSLPAWTVDERGERTSYWPQRWSIARLEAKQRELEITGNGNFDLMYLQDRTVASGKTLKAEWLQPLIPESEIDLNWPVFYGVDMAFTLTQLGLTRNKDPDYFCIAKWKVAPWGAVLYDGVRERVTHPEAIQMLRTHADMDKPLAIGLPATPIDDTMFHHLLSGKFLPLVRVKSKYLQRDKGARFLGGMAPYFRHHRARLSDGNSAFLKAFRLEWLSFPGAHDDTLDAAFIGLMARPQSVGALQVDALEMPVSVRNTRERNPYAFLQSG